MASLQWVVHRRLRLNLVAICGLFTMGRPSAALLNLNVHLWSLYNWLSIDGSSQLYCPSVVSSRWVVHRRPSLSSSQWVVHRRMLTTLLTICGLFTMGRPSAASLNFNGHLLPFHNGSFIVGSSQINWPFVASS